MPHSTRASSASRVPSYKFPGGAASANSNGDHSTVRTSMEKFPDHVESFDGAGMYTESPTVMGGKHLADRWHPGLSRIDSGEVRKPPWSTGGRGHGRQKSLSDAFRKIRGRNGSVSQNVHEISDALKAPVSPKLVVRNPPVRHNISSIADVCTRRCYV